MSTRLVCDECKRICKKTPVGMCVILCNETKYYAWIVTESALIIENCCLNIKI